jgi:hypothetical protein
LISATGASGALKSVGLAFFGSAFFNSCNAFRVALALVIGLVHPYLFASTSLIHETEMIFLTAPQAMIPVPCEAG